MTGRELIRSICESMEYLDAEVCIEILQRDSEGSVTQKQSAKEVRFVNGNLKIENASISTPKN